MTTSNTALPAVDLAPCLLKMIDISTAHIPKHTADALGSPGDADKPALWDELSYVYYHEYGWIIFVARMPEELQPQHPELSTLFDLCLANDVGHLKLDCDAPTVEGLPTFEW